MRFRLMSLCISPLAILMPCVSATRAQAPRDIENIPRPPGKMALLPAMPIPKASSGDCASPSPACLRFARETTRQEGQRYAASRQHRVADKKFWARATATMGTSVLAVAATSHCRSTVGIESCAGHYGSFKGMQGIQLGLNGFLTGLSYLWKKSEQESQDRHPQWWVVPLGMTAFNTYRVVNQYQKHCRPGTTFNGDTCR
jgi:hypothetical protein